MNDIDDREIERRLRAVPPAPIPEGLGDRVLAAARSHRAAKAWTTPRQRLWLAAGAVVLLFVFAADAYVSRAQRTRLFALSGSSRPVTPRPEDQNGILAEVIGKGVIPRLEAPRIRTIPPAVSEALAIEELTEESHDSQKSLH